METFLIKAAQLILAFAILVIIHEFGHFLFARIFGVRVEKFYIFFDPWVSLFKWKPGKYIGIPGKTKKLGKSGEESGENPAEPEGEVPTVGIEEKKKRKAGFWKDTEYGIGWLPLGGYCKISGMIDESMDTEQMKKPAQPWEFRAKPAWQRLLIMIAGVLFNFLLAILIYAGITWWWGDDYVPFSESKGLIKYSQTAQKYGFRDGDIPLTADGKPVDSPDDLFAIGNARQVRVLRAQKDTVTINLPSNFLIEVEQGSKNDKRGIDFMQCDIPVVVHSIASDKARKAGLLEMDEMIAVNGKNFKGATEFLPLLAEQKGNQVDVTVVRRKVANPKAAGDTLVLHLPLDGNKKIGFQLENDARKLFNVKTVRYNILESIPVGISKGAGKMKDYVVSLKYIFTKEGAQSVGGFGAIGNLFPESWNWLAFWNIAAFLSVALAFMNILPIPALDGGHVLFLLYEVIFRRKPSEKFLERAQIVGMILLLALLIYANGMDIVRFFFK